jgi:hypothetical protein
MDQPFEALFSTKRCVQHVLEDGKYGVLMDVENPEILESFFLGVFLSLICIFFFSFYVHTVINIIVIWPLYA